MAVRRAVTNSPVAVIGLIALAVNACGGAVPTIGPVADGGPGASGAPAASAGLIGSGRPAGSGIPAGSIGPGGGDVIIVADEDSNFTTNYVFAPAGKAFNILFQNKTLYTLHDVDITSPDGSKIIFDGSLVYGPKDVTYNVPAMPAGTYRFVCSVHPGQMTGTFKAG